MNVGVKLAAYGFVLAGAFGVGAGLGEAVGPIDDDGDDETEHVDHNDG